ncbi:Scavenger receptor class A member 5 [Takifugu flavidus]|uniref:Scavenger receptor class A member 5 n=1 Tax=Takifugu flavidus TaxID=433684 RepID=A0A5C6NMZ7_9TELE|nr:Scavenger receptor class A member 5 [Takifugu flavidus]
MFRNLKISHVETFVSTQRQEVLMENVTTTSENSRTAQMGVDEASTESDLLENIWKLENLFQNHSEWLQRLEILIKVPQWNKGIRRFKRQELKHSV